MLDAGTDAAVRGVVVLFPSGQLSLPTRAPVWDDEPGAPIAAVRDDCGFANGGLGSGLLPRLAVVAVAGQGLADHHDEPGVGVDDDLVVGGVPVVFRLRGDRMIAGGHQGAVDDEHGVLAEPLAGPER
jgi:hypothetical protein